MEEESLKRARSMALRALARSACSQAQIEQRLTQKGYRADVIAQVVDELKALGWLDDVQFARTWITDRADRKRFGRRRLLKELKERGISEEVLEEALPPVEAEEELARARAAIARRWPPGCLADLEGKARLAEKRRCAAFLERRGFDAETIKKVLTELMSK